MRTKSHFKHLCRTAKENFFEMQQILSLKFSENKKSCKNKHHFATLQFLSLRHGKNMSSLFQCNFTVKCFFEKLLIMPSKTYQTKNDALFSIGHNKNSQASLVIFQTIYLLKQTRLYAVKDRFDKTQCVVFPRTQ